MTMHQRLQALILSFPTLRRTPEELLPTPAWDPIRFAQFWATGSGGEKDAALFVLSVWNPETDWAAQKDSHGLRRRVAESGRFDLHTALSNWDPEHRAAFVAWCKDPWWC